MESWLKVPGVESTLARRRHLVFTLPGQLVLVAAALVTPNLFQPASAQTAQIPASTASAPQAPGQQASTPIPSGTMSSAPIAGAPASAASQAVIASAVSAASNPGPASNPAWVASTPTGTSGLSAPSPSSAPTVDAEEQFGKSYGWIFASFLALLSLLVSAFSALMSILTIWRNWSIARVNIVASCHKTYGEIFSSLFELREAHRLQAPAQANQGANQQPVLPTAEVKSRAHSLFIKLWNLQHEQYLYYREGLIPQPIFESWLAFRYSDYHSNSYDFDGVNYKWAWDTRKTEFGAQSEFVQFMDLAMDTSGTYANAPNASALATQAAMQRYQQSMEASNIKRHWRRIMDFYKH
ncbi:hypothetical protein [Paraburkholderia sp. C35]|uniref:hypothetical protein n=1 Tax=Paraburkholderia sp. C35 TaxID=2126993 RepID=UPI0013A54ED4|nr:hypothetical protein [Paraburkholderia sp. C35]